MSRLKTTLAAVAMLAVTATAVSADTYVIDPSHSTVGFAVRHMVITNVKGAFDKLDGKIVLNRDNPGASSVEVSIDAASVNTRDKKRDEHLASPDFLDAASYPAITFTSKKVSRVGNDWTATGDLTIRGVTKTVELKFAVNGPIQNPWGQTVIGIEVETLKVNRHDYGVKWSKKMDNGGLVVGDDVKIEIALEAKKEG